MLADGSQRAYIEAEGFCKEIHLMSAKSSAPERFSSLFSKFSFVNIEPAFDSDPNAIKRVVLHTDSGKDVVGSL